MAFCWVSNPFNWTLYNFTKMPVTHQVSQLRTMRQERRLVCFMRDRHAAFMSTGEQQCCLKAVCVAWAMSIDLYTCGRSDRTIATKKSHLWVVCLRKPLWRRCLLETQMTMPITLLRVILTMTCQDVYLNKYFLHADILSDILSGILSDINSDILSGILSGTLSDIYSGILSGILYLAFYLTYILAFYLAFSIWHIFWHSIWHSIWHIFWHSIWHSIWHLFWHSIWHTFWHSIWAWMVAV